MIHKLAPEGATLATFGGYGVKPGKFLYPVAAAVAPDDSILVLDAETHLVQRFDNSGKYLSSFGGRGDGEGTFNKPRNLCVGHDGAIYVLDYGNRQVQRFSADGRYETRWAFRRAADRVGMRVLNGFAVDQTGNLYLSEVTSGKIRMITSHGKVARSYRLGPLQEETVDTLVDLGVDNTGTP